MNINEGVLRTTNVKQRNTHPSLHNKRINNVVTIQQGKQRKHKPLEVNAFRSDTSSSAISTKWKNSENNTIDLNSSVSNNNRSFALNTTNSAEGRIILAITEGRGDATCEVGIAAINVCQPELILCQISDNRSYTNIITKINVLNPVEIIIPTTMAESRMVQKIKDKFTDIKITGVNRVTFNKESGMQYIKHLCAPKWNSVILMLQHRFYALTAAGALLTYLQINLHTYYSEQSIKVEYQESEHYCVIDIFTADKLELVTCALTNVKEKYSSLFGVINHCQTKVGSRMLRATILQPPSSVEIIEARLNCIEELIAHPGKITAIQGILKQVSYIDQLLSLGWIIPEKKEDCSSRQLNYVLMLNFLFDSLEPLSEILVDLIQPTFVEIKETLTNEGLTYLKDLIRAIVNENARPAKGQEGITERCFAIKEGQYDILDLFRKKYSKLLNEMQEYVKSLSEKYGLNLKLSNNNAKGYHIVMPLSMQQRKTFKKSSLPKEFEQVERKTTMVVMKTIKILAYSNQIDDIESSILRISNIIIFTFLTEVRKKIEIFYKLCEDIAKLDVLQSLAEVCSSNQTYVRPEFGEILEVIDSRHPMLNFLCNKEPTSNDIRASKYYNVNIITGPNGSGKSIYIRQIVLLQVMAQIGCFVPATSAKFRVADRILARIYLEDNINCGASTFVLEMQEINYFLNVMTNNTLVIVDELCRSTSVEEGAALAMAICERFLSTPAFVFFSTHYSLVTKLKDLSLNIKCWQLEAIEHEMNNEYLRFTHKVVSGVTSLTGYAIGLAKRCWHSDIITYIKNILQVIKNTEESYEVTNGCDPRLCLKYDLESELKLLKYNNQLTHETFEAKLNKYWEDLQNCDSLLNISYVYPEVVYSNSQFTNNTISCNNSRNENFNTSVNIDKMSSHNLSKNHPIMDVQNNKICSDENYCRMKQSNYNQINNENVEEEVIDQSVETEQDIQSNYQFSKDICEGDKEGRRYEQIYETTSKNPNIIFDVNVQLLPHKNMNTKNAVSNFEIDEDNHLLTSSPQKELNISTHQTPFNFNHTGTSADFYPLDQSFQFPNISNYENLNMSLANNDYGNEIQNLNKSMMISETEQNNIDNSKGIRSFEETVNDDSLNKFSLPNKSKNLNNSKENYFQPDKNIFYPGKLNFRISKKPENEDIFSNELEFKNTDINPEENLQLFKNNNQEDNYFKESYNKSISRRNLSNQSQVFNSLPKSASIQKLMTINENLLNESNKSGDLRFNASVDKSDTVNTVNSYKKFSLPLLKNNLRSSTPLPPESIMINTSTNNFSLSISSTNTKSSIKTNDNDHSENLVNNLNQSKNSEVEIFSQILTADMQDSICEKIEKFSQYLADDDVCEEEMKTTQIQSEVNNQSKEYSKYIEDDLSIDLQNVNDTVSKRANIRNSENNNVLHQSMNQSLICEKINVMLIDEPAGINNRNKRKHECISGHENEIISENNYSTKPSFKYSDKRVFEDVDDMNKTLSDFQITMSENDGTVIDDFKENTQENLLFTSSDLSISYSPEFEFLNKKTTSFDIDNRNIPLEKAENKDLKENSEIGTSSQGLKLLDSFNSDKAVYYNDSRKNVSESSVPQFNTSSSSKTIIDVSRGNTSEIIENYQQSSNSSTSIKADYPKLLTTKSSTSKESTKNNLFQPPFKKSASSVSSLKDYKQACLQRDIENIHLTGEKCEQYFNEMLNRPTPRQLKGMEKVATVQKTKEGPIIIEHKHKQKRFRPKKFQPPIKRIALGQQFDGRIFSDENIDVYNECIKNDCEVGDNTTFHQTVQNRNSSGDYTLVRAFGNSSSSSNVVNNKK